MPTSTPAGSITSSEDVIEVIDAAAAHDVLVWVDGGWGVDALLGNQTREHGDLDLVIENREAAAFEAALRALGYERCDETSATAWNFLMAHPRGSVVDLHLIERDPVGNGLLGPRENNDVYPADALRGEGKIGGRAVRCIAAASAVAFHDAYVGDANDRADVRALCDRFGLTVPPQFR